MTEIGKIANRFHIFTRNKLLFRSEYFWYDPATPINQNNRLYGPYPNLQHVFDAIHLYVSNEAAVQSYSTPIPTHPPKPTLVTKNNVINVDFTKKNKNPRK